MSVDSLREQLKERGYLTHGIERWFALDPWSSRTFWVELVLVALKAATVIAVFGALAPTAVMLVRNMPVGAAETLGLYLSYALFWLVASFALVVVTALLLKIRPSLPIDTPRALLAISLLASGLLLALFALWWWRFDAPPSLVELAAGAGLSVFFFLVATIVVSAALLSFSIYEVQRIPLIHQRRRVIPMAAAAALLGALLFLPAYGAKEQPAPQPMVVTAPTSARVALFAVDGLTHEILQSRADLSRLFTYVHPVATLPGESTTERWASLGTGVPNEAHGVRSIEGIRFRGGTHVLQRISRSDLMLLEIVPAAGFARREPLPPAVRRRDYVWEILAGRGIPALAVNWWATADAQKGALRAIGPESIFSAAQGDPVRVDSFAVARFLAEADRNGQRLAAVYLPALDVVLNRQPLEQSSRLAQSLRALEGLTQALALARARGYDVILAGLPGDGQSGSGVVASTLPLRPSSSAWDVAPTLLTLFGFPLSAEMPGRSLAPSPLEARIPTYGTRGGDEAVTPALNEEYYENLKSLGYIR